LALQRLVEGGRDPADHDVLGVVGNIGAVEIADIVIPDAVIGRAPGQMVQHPLIDRTGHHQPIGQSKHPHPAQHTHQRWRGGDDRGQPPDPLGFAVGRGTDPQ
jgi:hypothetical protein